MKAFFTSTEYMDIYNYPDAFLRVLKYCADEFTPDARSEIAQKCIEGFQKRIDNGDNYTEKLLKEAEELYVKYKIIID